METFFPIILRSNQKNTQNIPLTSQITSQSKAWHNIYAITEITVKVQYDMYPYISVSTAELLPWHEWILRPVASTGLQVNKYFLDPLSNPLTSTPHTCEQPGMVKEKKIYQCETENCLALLNLWTHLVQLKTRWPRCPLAKFDPL